MWKNRIETDSLFYFNGIRYLVSLRGSKWVQVTLLRKRTFIFGPYPHCRKLKDEKRGHRFKVVNRVVI